MSSGNGLLRRLTRPLRVRWRRAQRRGGILMYHRIAEEACDPWGLCVTPAHFEEQMAFLAERGAAVDLASFATDDAYTAEGARIAVTFDDGYVDNLEQALPILERHGIPATIFLVGHAPGRQREFWWDALQRAIMESGHLPATLDFPFGDGPRSFTFSETEEERLANAAWNADDDDPGTPRQSLFLALWSAIVVLPPDEQDAAVDYLLAWAGMPVAAPVGRLPASADAFARLAGHPLVSIGSHTLDHASLTDLSRPRQHAQIVEGHRAVEALMGQRIDRFSYPFGRIDDGARAEIAALGVDVACTSVGMAATIGDNRRELPRLQVTDRSGADFARWLREDHGLLAAA